MFQKGPLENLINQLVLMIKVVTLKLPLQNNLCTCKNKN